MLVDYRVLVREGLAALIVSESDLVVVGHAASVYGARTLDITPDVIVTGIDLPDAKRGDVVTALRGAFPPSSILVLSLEAHPAKVESVLAAGAHGYLLLTAGTDDLLTGIRALAADGKYLQPSLAGELETWRSQHETTLRLSARQQQVVRLLALGHTNTEVARMCGVSIRTVETHRARIYQKLGRRTRAELVQYARSLGLIDDELE
ncbi:MAG: response regulator transcription factor [Actinomycetota bacterium]|nr:response regulator transcription factor [Actinomycetota bacterium]